MKLRIRGDSIRLRLSKSEVKRISEGEAVEEFTRFPDGSQLSYVLASSNLVSSVEARLDERRITISLPLQEALAWANSDGVAIKGHQNLNVDEGAQLSILIEKDFVCLKPRENEFEDESDLFLNPNQSHKGCG